MTPEANFKVAQNPPNGTSWYKKHKICVQGATTSRVIFGIMSGGENKNIRPARDNWNQCLLQSINTRYHGTTQQQKK